MKVFWPVIVLLLSACAFSPQQVAIRPAPLVDAENYGMGKGLAVTVEDRRADKVLGSRGGIYRDTSIITIKNDLNEAIASATRASLAMQGFDVNAQQPLAEYTVVVEELRYDVPASTLMSKVDLLARISVEVRAGGETYTGRYTTESERKLVGNPGPEKIAGILSELLTDTLARSYQDQKLKAFLSNL